MILPKRKFNTIVIDPAWQISMTGEVKRREHRAGKLPYKTMTLEEIKKIPIGEIANKGCHVYCWTTNKMLKQTFDVLEAWGVNFHLVMPMVKPSGIAPCFGYVFASEFCLLGFYGKPMQKFKRAGKLNWIKCFNKAGTHSSKPEEFYELVKEMSPFPRIDIFARSKHSGFYPFGDESPEFLCPKCSNKLIESDLEEYEWLCKSCDENFYNIEAMEVKQEAMQSEARHSSQA